MSVRGAWPMYLFAGAMVGLGVALCWILLWHGGGLYRGNGYVLLVCVAPFAAAAAAIRAVREELADSVRRRLELRRARKLDLREKLAPFPVDRAAALPVDDGPFRTAPRSAPIVIRAAAPGPRSPAPIVAPIVPGDDKPPTLLT